MGSLATGVVCLFFMIVAASGQQPNCRPIAHEASPDRVCGPLSDFESYSASEYRQHRIIWPDGFEHRPLLHLNYECGLKKNCCALGRNMISSEIRWGDHVLANDGTWERDGFHSNGLRWSAEKSCGGCGFFLPDENYRDPEDLGLKTPAQHWRKTHCTEPDLSEGPAEEQGPEDSGPCLMPAGCFETDENCQCLFGTGVGTPIIISLQGQRLELTDVEGGVAFDLNADGHAEHISWTAPRTDDAFLVLDRDGNGVIQDGSELFGDATPQPPASAPHGFLALAVYDDPLNGGDGNGRISSADEVFASLRLWTDWDHDGISRQDELISLYQARIESISLNYTETRRVDRHGNQFRYISAVTMEAGSGPARKLAIDVIFLTRDYKH